ncbi:phospholipase effector Tle1 domain-containing protein [Pseudomonas sp. C2B4]|uniref:DUF2235 domain-containing protein n=1 Tax=Pseudomonas sp. C2B4 TaxID=2735270 RepID=UPI0015863D63|nr:DUF2235 domain-containing protein [Pseudomonas sp. C2B4]
MSNLVICCDGTWNTPDQREHGIPAPTNVVRIYNAIDDIDEQGGKQNKYYHPGVGTDGNWWEKLLGGGAGEGLDKNIMSAYQRLCYNFDLKNDDQIFLFGFSRGAYTVRSLSGFITRCGLLEIKDLPPAVVWERIEYLLQCYRGKKDPRKDRKSKGWKYHNALGQDIKIRFIGVWDTVGALGIPDDMALLNLLDSRKDYTFHDTTLNKSVLTARHAIAMDELRATFQPTLWTDYDVAQDVKQVWFPGVHADVGGGYRECGLADGALKWMIEEAARCGLRFDDEMLKQIKPNYNDTMHDSCNGVFAMLPTQPRSIPILSDRVQLHSSAISRHKTPPISQCPYRRTLDVQPASFATLDISARNPWNETGLWLEQGVTYRFSASGEWMDASIACGPGGTDDGKFHPGETVQLLASALGKIETAFKSLSGNNSAEFQFTKRHEAFQWFSLIGCIANSKGVDDKAQLIPPETFLIGEGCQYTPKRSGYFYAYANDAWNCYGNNRGNVALTIERT